MNGFVVMHCTRFSTPALCDVRLAMQHAQYLQQPPAPCGVGVCIVPSVPSAITHHAAQIILCTISSTVTPCAMSSTLSTTPIVLGTLSTM